VSVINDRRYPNKGRLAFDGGLHNKFERSLILDNESPDCANVVFNDGAVSTRGGVLKLNTTPVGSYACDGLFVRHDNSGANTMVAWYNGNMYQLATTTFSTIASAQSVFTAGAMVYGAEYENYIFFGNGENTAYKYGGSGNTFTRHGIPAPTSTMTAATAGTGVALTGAYYYAVTYVNSGLVESDISPVCSTITVSGQNIALTSLPVAPQSFGVNARYLYRTEDGTSTLKRLATINDNTTTTYEDAIDDADLGISAPTDQGVPPTYSSIVYHQGRLFCIDPTANLVKYSEIGNPYVFKSTSFLRIGDNSFDIPKSLAVYDNSIVVNCRINPWMIYMSSTDPADWVSVRVKANYGTRSPRALFTFNNQLMFAATENDILVGFAAISGQTIAPDASLLTSSAIISEMQSERIGPEIDAIQDGYLSKVSAIVYKNRAYISVPYGPGVLANNRVLVYDFDVSRVKSQNAAWVRYTNINAESFVIYNGDLYFASSAADGFIHQMETTTYSDNGLAIDSYYLTKEYTGFSGDENIFKDFRYAQLFFEKPGDWYMNFGVRVDSDLGGFDLMQVDLNPGGSLWGSMRWGLDTWGGGSSEAEERMYLSPRKGKRIQFKFSNQNIAGQSFKVLGLNFVYNNKGWR
jgi:hypothetical protein